jgi:hypothetical protein
MCVGAQNTKLGIITIRSNAQIIFASSESHGRIHDAGHLS